MEQWPALPPITDAASNQPCYQSGGTPTKEDLSDRRNVDRLLSGSWPDVSASRGDGGTLKAMTEMYSVDMGDVDNKLLHILPWTNLSGYRQTFFPSSGNVEEDMDKLTELAEPW